jgi:hypothetical protein
LGRDKTWRYRNRKLSRRLGQQLYLEPVVNEHIHDSLVVAGRRFKLAGVVDLVEDSPERVGILEQHEPAVEVPLRRRSLETWELREHVVGS